MGKRAEDVQLDASGTVEWPSGLFRLEAVAGGAGRDIGMKPTALHGFAGIDRSPNYESVLFGEVTHFVASSVSGARRDFDLEEVCRRSAAMPEHYWSETRFHPRSPISDAPVS